MNHDLRELLIPSIIAVPFFIFGFFTAADLLDLTLRDMMIGVLAGAICGVTMLCAFLHQAAHDDAALPS